MRDTLGAMFVRAGERYADRLAVKSSNGQRTYVEVLENGARVANVLREAGLRPGDRVAIMFENRVEAVEALAGVTIGGFVIVPVNGHFKAAEVDHLLKNSGARALIHTDGVRAATEGAQAALRFGFDEWKLPEIVALTVRANLRSRRVMEKLGMTYNPADDFDHPRLPQGHPLRPHVLYRGRPGQCAG